MIAKVITIVFFCILMAQFILPFYIIDMQIPGYWLTGFMACVFLPSIISTYVLEKIASQGVIVDDKNDAEKEALAKKSLFFLGDALRSIYMAAVAGVFALILGVGLVISVVLGKPVGMGHVFLFAIFSFFFFVASRSEKRE
jgi:hypothetical protein